MRASPGLLAVRARAADQESLRRIQVLLTARLQRYGAKDLWQHRTGYVANTRWWPPFCVTVDWLAAMIMAVAISADASFS